MEDEIECPYCGKYTDEPDECYEQDENYEVECKHCDKLFFGNFSYLKVWGDSLKADCLNEGDHNFENVGRDAVRFDKDSKKLVYWYYRECVCGEKIEATEEEYKNRFKVDSFTLVSL